MKDPIPTFTYLVSQVVQRHPDLAYLHVIEPGVAASEDCTHNGEEVRSSTDSDIIRSH